MTDTSNTHVSLLMRLADANDDSAWRDFQRRYGELIRRFAHRQNLPSSDIDDVLQEVLISLTRNMPKFRYDPAKGKFRSYLKTIVVRAVYRRFRQKNRPGVEVELDHAGGQIADEAEIEQLWNEEWRQHHLRTAMAVIHAEFNAQDVAAFDAYVTQGKTAAETAQELGLSTDQVYQAKSRIVKRLSALIEDQIKEEG